MIEQVTSIDKLREIALDQYGYVTFAQAMGSGVSQPAVSMLVKRQRLRRVAQGVYRVPQIAPTKYDNYMLALLWTGVPEACLSHDTALDLYEVCDINPSEIHITVSKKRRIKRKGGDGYILHKQDLEPSQISWFEGMQMVTLPQAILQCIQNGAPSHILNQAMNNGKKRGLLPGDDMDNLLIQLEHRNERNTQSS
jgi:predicted transcriptional regulator of viral defense system